MPAGYEINIPSQLSGAFSTIGILDVIDILIVAVIIYKIYEMLQDTRAITLVKGLFVLMILSVQTGSKPANLRTRTV